MFLKGHFKVFTFVSVLFISVLGFSASEIFASEKDYSAPFLPCEIPVILGFEGTSLSNPFKLLLERFDICGVILFERNLPRVPDGSLNLKKLDKLCSEIRKYCPYLAIDQEGGRVQRLKDPPFMKFPAASTYETLENGTEVLRRNVRLMSEQLMRFGFNLNCAPCADLTFEGIESFIGDRSFGKSPEFIENSVKVWIETASKKGVTSVVKHCPGHGKAVGDSHSLVPIVSDSPETLKSGEPLVFKNIAQFVEKNNLKESTWFMVPHVLYSAIDNKRPASISPKVIQFIRKFIGFSGTLMTDCIAMGGLAGDPEHPRPLWERALLAKNAGCDVILCCHGTVSDQFLVLKALSIFLDMLEESGETCLSDDELTQFIEAFREKCKALPGKSKVENK